jgi:hypothetical protein
MNETMLTWNIRNWLTVVLMAALGWLLVTFALRASGLHVNAANNPNRQNNLRQAS